MPSFLLLWMSISISSASPWNADEGPLADEILALDGRNEWITARRKAEELLAEDPESYTGHHVLGRAFWQGEGDYARAIFHLKKSLEIYEKRFKGHPDPPWRLESEGWWSLRIITGDKGDYEGELELIEKYNQKQVYYQTEFGSAYNTLIAERGWPLMKLQRYEEAKYWANKGIDSERDWQKSLGYNVLCATAGEEGIRVDSLLNCEAALDHAYESGTGITIDSSNACNAAFGVFDFETAERYAIAATKANDGSTISAWMNLLYMNLSRGQGDGAVSSMQGMRSALAAEDPDMRNQKRADVDASFSLLLLVAGKAQEAFDKVDRALKYPDRRGTISTTEEQSRGSHTTLRYVARRVLAEREKERVASLGFWERCKHWWFTLFGDPDLVIDEAGIRNALSDEERLISTIRPYLDKGLTGVPTWMVGELITILGVGVVEVALEKARAIDSYPGTEGYYSSIETEIAYHRRDWEEVIRLGQQTRESLPQMEQLMRARMFALEGVAHKKEGEIDNALRSWSQAMETDPSVFRRLGIALPTQFSIASGMAGEVVDALSRSPRFYEAGSGFVVQVEDGSTCLLGTTGEMFYCSPWPARAENEDGEKQTDQEYLTAITEAFHEGAFGLSTGLSGADWNSLDGTTTSSKKAAREKLEKMLGTE